MRPIVFVSLAVSLIAQPIAAIAQQPKPAAASQGVGLPIVPGTRVRVTANTLVAPLVANFLEMRGDTAVFIENASGRGIWTFTLDQITKLERSIGEQSRNGDYMLKSGALGAGAGAILFFGFAQIIKPSDNTRRFNKAATTGIGALLGAGVGAYIGSRRTREGWGELPLPHRMSFLPTRRGFEVGLGFDF